MVKFGKLQDLVGDDEFELEQEKNLIQDYSDEPEDEESVYEVDEDEDFDTFSQLSTQATRGLHLRCFAHSLQLVIKTSLKRFNNAKKLMTKCFKIGTKSRQKKCFADFLSSKNYNLILKPIEVRWNSQLKTLRAILKIKLEDLNIGLSSADESNLMLKHWDLIKLADLINILEPFEYVTDLLQGEYYSTLGLAIPSLYQLPNHLEDVKINNKCSKTLVEELRKELLERFTCIFTSVHDMSLSGHFNECCYFIVTYLDPSFKFYWIESTNLNETEVKVFKTCLKKIINENSNTSIQNNIENQSVQNDIPISPSTKSVHSDISILLLNSPTKRKKFFSYPKAYLKNSSENRCFEQEYQFYQNIEYDADVDVKEFWRKMKFAIPGLFNLAKKFLSIPVTSGPVERLFSSSGYIIRPHRSRLTPKNLEILTMMKCNLKTLKFEN